MNKSGRILKLLIANHNDRIACYEMGQQNTDDQELKTLFSHFIQVSKKIKEDISIEIRKSGAVPTDEAREGSKFSIACAEIMNALKKKEKDEILLALEQSEGILVEVYDKVLSDYEDEISTDQQVALIKVQQRLLKANLKEVIDSRRLS